MEDERDENIEELDLPARLRELLPGEVDDLEDSERRRSYTLAALQFETFVVELLRATGESAGRVEPRVPSPSNDVRFDFVSETSFNDLPPPIGVEVKYFRSGVRMAAAAREFRAIARASQTRVRTLVFVTNLEPTPQDLAALRGDGDAYDELPRYHWWGPKMLQSLLERLGEGGRRILDTLQVDGLRAALRNVSRGEAGTWRAARSTILSELRQSWRDDQLVLFLGAGVSIEAGVPLWGSLLASLYRRLLDKIDPTLVSAPPADYVEAVRSLLSLQDGSPLMSARMLRSGLGNHAFNDAVRAALYGTIKPREDSRQLGELARLCDPPRGRVGARAVVTYNFDNLLEQHLDALNVRYLSIATGNSRATWTQLPIYHVHGLIPQTGAVPREQTLVFSEEGYHTAYNNPYTWSNVIQLNLMTQYTCMFVGLSMTDPNLRRLLEIASAAESGPRHVALLRRVTDVAQTPPTLQCSSSDPACAATSRRAASPVVTESVLAIHHTAWETTLNELGVRILWFEEFAEIPEILARIRE
jgi:hypothetical protein